MTWKLPITPDLQTSFTQEETPMNAPIQAPDEQREPGSGHAQLTNMQLALETLLACDEAGENSPRLGLFYGFSGYGKTVAAAFSAARTGAAYIEAKSIWTQRSILEAIAQEVGIIRLERSAPRILQQIIETLVAEPRPLIIDEMDHLVKKQSVEIIRDIHDATRIGIMMIGEEALPAKLKAWERFDNRILMATPAQPASLDDARLLRDHYCTEVRVGDDLVDLIAERCRGVTRRIVVNLVSVQRKALSDGLTHADARWWGNRQLLATGDLPTRRKAA